MGRKVRQSDGTYCYTENCRIHDRAQFDSAGNTAVMADARAAERNYAIDMTASCLQTNAIADPKESRQIAEAVLTKASANGQTITPSGLAQELYTTAKEKGLDINPWSDAITLHQAIVDRAALRAGDEVVINETGERGVITEGDSRIGKVRFNPESMNSRNGFAWFDAGELTKLTVDDNSLMREKLVAMGRDQIVPASSVKTLIEEEISSSTRNAQGTREMGRNKKAAREALLSIGDNIEQRFEGRNLSRDRIIKVLNEEYFKEPEQGASESEVRAVKSGLRNIINYLERNPHA